jgi:hypothetical protein
MTKITYFEENIIFTDINQALKLRQNLTLILIIFLYLFYG